MTIFEASQGPFIIRAEILALENYGFWNLTHLKRVWKNRKIQPKILQLPC